MRFSVLILFICLVCAAQKRFQAEYFVEKHQLELPKTDKGNFDLERFSHISDRRQYFYLGNTADLDSVHRELSILGFSANITTDRYRYSDDTVYVTSISTNKSSGDTTSMRMYKHTDDFRTVISYNPRTACYWQTKTDARGIKKLDVKKCPSDQEYHGQEFILETKDQYILALEKYRGEIDSNSIRRYYLNAFDSIVADFMVKEGKDPFIVRLNTYGEDKRKTMSYGFGIYTKNFEVVEMDKYTYTDQGKLHRVYHFEVKKGDPNLVNYTEYEYDNLGRKARVTTRVELERRSQKEKPENVGK